MSDSASRGSDRVLREQEKRHCWRHFPSLPLASPPLKSEPLARHPSGVISGEVPLLRSGQPLWRASWQWCCGNSCSWAQLHPSPYQKLRQKPILLLLPHPVSSHSCEWRGLGCVHHAKLHLCSSLLFGEGLANTVSLWSRNFHTGSLTPHKAAVNGDSSISLSSVNGCLDI